jgi:carbamoyl-phosphate synthase large subunit
MIHDRIKVLVTGSGGAGTLGREIIKSFLMRPNNYEIIATNSNPIDLSLNNEVKTIQIPNSSSSNYLDELLKICKEEKIQAIAPGSEPETELISKNSKIFYEQNIVVLTNSYDLVKLCNDKLSLSEFLIAKGIKSPQIFSIEDISEHTFSDYPLLIKPTIGSGSRNVFVAKNFAEASFFTKYLIKQNIKPLIQEYISGINNEFSIGVLYCQGGILTTSIAMRRSFSSGLSTRSVIKTDQNESLIISSGISQGFFDDFPDIRKKSEYIASVLNSDGPINIQCRIKNDELYVFEINPRFSGTTSARALVGCNEPDILTNFRINGEIPKTINYKYGYVMKDFLEKFVPKNDINMD